MMQLKHTVFTAAFALSCLVGVDAFFRINCEVVQTGRIDPIINPGAVAPHCHTIVGGSSKSPLHPPQRVQPMTPFRRYRRQFNVRKPVRIPVYIMRGWKGQVSLLDTQPIL